MKKKHIRSLEAARGMAAYYILFHHALLLAGGSGAFADNLLLKTIHDFSSAFVAHILMMFFLLSGFSIHYANRGRINTVGGPQVRDYLYKRFRRIYPIYLLAVVLSLLAIYILDRLGAGADWPYPTIAQMIGGLLLFSDLPSHDGTWIPTLSTNGPLWSLSYEALYYALYPVFSVITFKKGIRFSVIAAALMSLTALVLATVMGPNQLTNMLSLYVLWCLGAYLAQLKRENHSLQIKPIVAFVLLFGWAQSLWIFESFLLWRIPLAFHLYTGLFIFFLMLCGIAKWPKGTWSRNDRIIGISSLVGFSLGALALQRLLDTTNNETFFVVRVALTFLIGALWLAKAPTALLSWIRQRLEPWHNSGAYSYGLYILQFPFLAVVLALSIHYGASPLWVLAGVVPAILFARWIELWCQPRVAKAMDSFRIRENDTGPKPTVNIG